METYKLEIPRPQFDRIGDAFELEDHFVNGYDVDKDTVIFTVSEKQRKHFAKCFRCFSDTVKITVSLSISYPLTK